MRAFLVILTFMSASVSLWAQGGRGLSQDWPVVFRDTLRLKILPFWLDHASDQQEGGLLGRLDRQGNPIPPGNKSVVLIARSLWSFSEAYRRYPEPAYQKVAAECLRFLREKMWDREGGGYYFLVTREGQVIDSSKQLNPMSYVMEGLAEYALAFHDPQARREALDLFRVIDQHAHDNEHGGYRTAFTKDWQWIQDYRPGPNAGGSFGRKSYDWHLGLVEAFATLYDVTGDARVKQRLNELLDIFVHKIIDAKMGYGRYYFSQDWRVADRGGDSKQCEYGLDLEASWLLVQAAELVGRGQDANIRRASLALVDHALQYGGRFRTQAAGYQFGDRQVFGHFHPIFTGSNRNRILVYRKAVRTVLQNLSCVSSWVRKSEGLLLPLGEPLGDSGLNHSRTINSPREFTR